MNKSQHGHKPIKTGKTGSTPSKELAELKKGIAHLKKTYKIIQGLSAKSSVNREYHKGKFMTFEMVLRDLDYLTKPADMDKVDDVL